MSGARALLASLVLSLSACSAEPACDAPSDHATTVLRLSDGAPVMALARGEHDLGLVYVLRPPWPLLAHFVFQRLALDGSVLGDPATLSPVDQSIPGTVTITRDGASYLACTVIVGGASCFRVDDAGAVTEDAMVVEATALAIARGASGVVGAWVEGGVLRAGPLDGGVSTLATTDAAPAIAPNDHGGLVVAYVEDGAAWWVTLDPDGRATHPTSLGPALAGTPVAVADGFGRTGAAWLGPAGELRVAVLAGGVLSTRALDGAPGAQGSLGIAASSEGFFVTWSDPDGAIHGVRVDAAGEAVGAPYVHDVGRTDAVHALVALDAGFVLAAPTTRYGTPLHVALVGCP